MPPRQRPSAEPAVTGRALADTRRSSPVVLWKSPRRQQLFRPKLIGSASHHRRDMRTSAMTQTWAPWVWEFDWHLTNRCNFFCDYCQRRPLASGSFPRWRTICRRRVVVPTSRSVRLHCMPSASPFAVPEREHREPERPALVRHHLDEHLADLVLARCLSRPRLSGRRLDQRGHVAAQDLVPDGIVQRPAKRGVRHADRARAQQPGRRLVACECSW